MLLKYWNAAGHVEKINPLSSVDLVDEINSRKMSTLGAVMFT